MKAGAYHGVGEDDVSGQHGSHADAAVKLAGWMMKDIAEQTLASIGVTPDLLALAYCPNNKVPVQPDNSVRDLHPRGSPTVRLGAASLMQAVLAELRVYWAECCCIAANNGG